MSGVSLIRVAAFYCSMSDLKCTKCGATASYADANIGNIRRTCGATLSPDNTTKRGTARGGEKHNWIEI